MFWMRNLNESINEDIINLLKLCDVITVEDRKIQQYLNSVWGIDVKYVPNG